MTGINFAGRVLEEKISEYLIRKIKMEICTKIVGVKMDEVKKFNVRLFVTFGMLFSGLGLPVSGIFNHYLGFSELTIGRHAWMSVHNVLGVLFILFTTWHIRLNRKSMAAAVKKHAGFLFKREAAIAAAVIFTVMGLFLMHVFHAR